MSWLSSLPFEIARLVQRATGDRYAHRYFRSRLVDYDDAILVRSDSRLSAVQLVSRSSDDVLGTTLVYLGPAVSERRAYYLPFLALLEAESHRPGPVVLACEVENDKVLKDLERLAPELLIHGGSDPARRKATAHFAEAFHQAFDHIKGFDADAWSTTCSSSFATDLSRTDAARYRFALVVLPDSFPARRRFVRAVRDRVERLVDLESLNVETRNARTLLCSDSRGRRGGAISQEASPMSERLGDRIRRRDRLEPTG